MANSYLSAHPDVKRVIDEILDVTLEDIAARIHEGDEAQEKIEELEGRISELERELNDTQSQLEDANSELEELKGAGLT